MTYRKKIAIFFIGYSLSLSVIYSSLVVGSLFIIEDRLYERFLSQYLSIIELPLSPATATSSTVSQSIAVEPIEKAAEVKANTAQLALLAAEVDKAESKHGDVKPATKQVDSAAIPVISRQVYTEQNMPEYLKKLSPGVTELDDMHILMQRLGNGRSMVLSMPEFGDLIDQIIPFALTLLFIIGAIISVLGTLVALILARQLSRPIENLVMDVRQASVNTSNICRDGHSTELNLLARSFNETMLRISMTLEREKSFTQSVSHELRTPLMVMETNLAILQQHKDPQRVLQRTTARMQRAAQNMTNLTDTFLMLARHDKFSMQQSSFNPAVMIKAVVQNAVQRESEPSVNWMIECQQGTQVTAPEKLFEILINNIVDNGNKYATGVATIVVTNAYLSSENALASLGDTNHGGNNSSQLGLKIIERICQALGWQMSKSISTEKFCLQINFST